MSDLWQKCISESGAIRGVAIRCTELSRSIAGKHGLKGDEARALGEALVGGFILASYTKSGERMNLNIKGDGWVKQALVDAHPDGTIRGYIVSNPPLEDGVHFSLGNQGPWGQGLLSVLRKRDAQPGSEPYIGTIPLLTGHLAKDLSFYWLQSEQVASAVGIAIHLDEAGEISSAGGFLVQAMPGASEEEIRGVESRVISMKDLEDEIASNREPIHLLSRLFQDMSFMLLEKKELRAECNCSWDRVRKALTLVGSTELQSMLDDNDGAVVNCDFCSTEYKIDSAELRKMIEEAKA
jgi:molecular chaperone Hsp33